MGKQEIDKSFIQRAEKQNKVNTNLRDRNVMVSLMIFYLADEQNTHIKCIDHIGYLFNKKPVSQISSFSPSGHCFI